jgi:hypothetical protein
MTFGTKLTAAVRNSFWLAAHCTASIVNMQCLIFRVHCISVFEIVLWTENKALYRRNAGSINLPRFFSCCTHTIWGLPRPSHIIHRANRLSGFNSSNFMFLWCPTTKYLRRTVWFPLEWSHRCQSNSVHSGALYPQVWRRTVCSNLDINQHSSCYWFQQYLIYEEIRV